MFVESRLGRVGGSRGAGAEDEAGDKEPAARVVNLPCANVVAFLLSTTRPFRIPVEMSRFEP